MTSKYKPVGGHTVGEKNLKLLYKPKGDITEQLKLFLISWQTLGCIAVKSTLSVN